MLSYSGGYDPCFLQRHFIAGIVTAVGANLALLFKLVADAYPAAMLAALFAYQLVLLRHGPSLALAGHLGASITHGEDYLTEYAPNPVRRALGLPIHIDPADQPWKPLPERSSSPRWWPRSLRSVAWDAIAARRRKAGCGWTVMRRS